MFRSLLSLYNQIKDEKKNFLQRFLLLVIFCLNVWYVRMCVCIVCLIICLLLILCIYLFYEPCWRYSGTFLRNIFKHEKIYTHENKHSKRLQASRISKSPLSCQISSLVGKLKSDNHSSHRLTSIFLPFFHSERDKTNINTLFWRH